MIESPLTVFWKTGEQNEPCLWLDIENVIPSEEIYERRRVYCLKHGWTLYNAEDNYTDLAGAIDWWNEEIIKDLKFENLQGGNWREATEKEKHIFYNSFDWRYIKYLVFCIEKGQCNHCGKHTDTPEYNHKLPIFPPGNKMFYRNFWLDSIETVCPTCHAKYHQEYTNGGNEFVYDPDKSYRDFRRNKNA